jgi:hypothetical protein
LIYSLLTAPQGATINPTNGIVIWRPLISQIGTNHLFRVKVTETGWLSSLAPVADAYVRDGSFASSNFGSDALLAVRLSGTGFARESYLKFDMVSVPGEISEARLQLNPTVVAVPATHALGFVTNDAWTESTLTWNTKPLSGGALTTWVPQAGVLVDVAVTALVQQTAAEDKLLSLRVFSTNTTSDRVEYAAREATNTAIPQIQILSTNNTSLSATQSFWVTVVSPARPLLSQSRVQNGAFTMMVSGDPGPNYLIQAATNLTAPVAWTTLVNTNPIQLPFNWTDTNNTVFPERYYRVLLGP